MKKIASFIQYIRQHWIVSLIIVAAVFTVISIILRVLTPPQSAVPITPQLATENFNKTQTTFTSIAFTGKVPEFPKTLTLASATNAPLQFNATQDELISSFQLKQSPTSPNFWEGVVFSLFWNEEQGWLQLSRNFLPEEVDVKSKTISKDQAVSLAQQFVQQYLPDLKLTAQTNSLRYAVDAEGFSSESSEKAIIIRVPFTYEVNNIPVYYKNESDYPFLIDVNGKQEISQATIYNHFITLNPMQSFSTITVEQAIENIKNGKGSVLSAYNGVGGNIPLSRLSGVQFSNVSLEYRVDAATQTAYPFFRFQGTAFATDNSTLTIEAITPAIQTTSPSAQ